MAYSVTNLNADLSSILHGTSLGQINNLFGLYNRAARQLLLDLDPQELKRISQITTPVYNQVWDYGLPVDLKGNKIIDIFPQVNRTSRDVFLQGYNQAFDVSKAWTTQDQFSVISNTGLKTIRFAAPSLTIPVQINQASVIQGNGTWTAGGDASNLTTDNLSYVVGGGSLQFDLADAGSSGYLENSTMSPLNLIDYVNQATNFLYSYFPSAAAFTSVEFRFGSSSSNYYHLTATTTQQNTVFQDGWNILQYVWSSMATVGTPNPESLGYVRVTFNYNGTAQTGVKLNDIFSALGTIMNIEYYSKYLFRTNTGTWQETVTDNSNLINLDTESYNLYLNQVAYLAAQQMQGVDAVFADAPMFLSLYQQGLTRYKSMYKSEIQAPQTTYYAQPNPSYRQWIGRGRWWGA